ncbi:MAG: TetR/AcrR family transcriptional regulator [Gammaproteobacteria bacterium]|nr:TetR/AcrR family transcriptional regulator [Gammaproteobacteria bacterium]NNJ49099.1 TetR/AcrR family transcriptional regulator [Gammaproteobacteria bacterium]
MSNRLSGPERRETIISAAQGLFASKGYHGVSIDEIARAVHVSPAILYRHFDSKQTLYAAVLEKFAGQRQSYVDTIVNHGTRFEDALAGMTQVYIENIAKNPDILKIELHSLLEGNPATLAFFQNRWKSFTDYIEFGLNEFLPYDVPHREKTILSAGLMFQGMVREALIQKCLQPQDRLIDLSLHELSNELVALFLRSIGINKTHLSRKATITG